MSPSLLSVCRGLPAGLALLMLFALVACGGQAEPVGLDRSAGKDGVRFTMELKGSGRFVVREII